MKKTIVFRTSTLAGAYSRESPSKKNIWKTDWHEPHSKWYLELYEFGEFEKWNRSTDWIVSFWTSKRLRIPEPSVQFWIIEKGKHNQRSQRNFERVIHSGGNLNFVIAFFGSGLKLSDEGYCHISLLLFSSCFCTIEDWERTILVVNFVTLYMNSSRQR